jgi:hypothetical protein
LRRDLVSFARAVFSDLNPQTRCAMSWHIEIIAARLDRIARRRDPALDHQLVVHH